MPLANQRLDHLRRDIDSIDMAIHDLIVKRATIVEDIGKIKNRAGPVLRPGREASILRQLAARHKGGFPLPALICIWRELMSAFTHMQGPLTAAVYAPAGYDRLVGLARNHYGSLTPLSTLSTASACVRAVAEGAVGIAVLPLPADSEAESWWPMLMGGDEKIPRVVSRLPFIRRAGGEQALVIAPWSRDSSADEASLIALHLGERTSRSRIMAGIAAAGFANAAALATTETAPDNCFHVVEVAGEVARDDARITALAGQFGEALRGAHTIGGYARSLALA